MKIRNSKDLKLRLKEIELEKELKRQLMENELEALKLQASSVQTGFELAQQIVSAFKTARENQIPPGEKLKNMALNFAIDFANDYLAKNVTQQEGEDEENEEQPNA